MKGIEFLRKLFTEQELNAILQKAHNSLQKELNDKDYRMAAFYSLDIAHIYDLLGDREKAEQHYRITTEYLDCADFQPLWIRLECLRALGKLEEAVKAALSNPSHSKIELAELYKEAGKHDIARKIYAELATRQFCNPDRLENFIYPQYLQHISNLWERAQNAEKAREFNESAREAWEKVEAKLEKHLYPIEKAWLNEGVGYIYEKACNFEKAMDYYQKAGEEYDLANMEKYRASSETHQVDGDWDHYAIYFYTQLPETLMINFLEYFMKFNFRRIKYRILMLEEKMRG
ncbi:MAG: hypothetical protein HXS46_17035 [Theionarchaea archaeon]|nr:MAG: hypothetical protein AYK18_12750 [Theionarchaea archaeon DG-70]MBU7012387.1 hypothetical protein [Theionarchaea archaeon]